MAMKPMTQEDVFGAFQIIFGNARPQHRGLLRFMLRMGESEGIFSPIEGGVLHQRFIRLLAEAEVAEGEGTE